MPDEPLGRRIAVINNKGGVGKTTVTRELAAALARAGRTVLCVDMDPQANLSRRLETTPIIRDDTPYTLTDVLAHPTKGGAADAITHCGWNTPEAAGIRVLPADLALEERANEAAEPGADRRLNRTLYGVTDEYDFTLLDCRPALGHLEQMVIASLNGDDDGVLIVVEPGADAISGAARVIEIIRDWGDRLDVAADIIGVIVNLVMDNTLLHRGRMDTLDESLSTDNHPAPPILTPTIPRAIGIAEIQDLALPANDEKKLQEVNHRFDMLAKQLVEGITP